MHFHPERLLQLRTSLNINKAEAARRLNISAMAYGRYEKGEREPSYQTVCFIAQTFHCNVEFLYGNSEKMEADYVIVSSSDTPELYALVTLLKEKHGMERRLLAYAQKLSKEKSKTMNAILCVIWVLVFLRFQSL